MRRIQEGTPANRCSMTIVDAKMICTVRVVVCVDVLVVITDFVSEVTIVSVSVSLRTCLCVVEWRTVLTLVDTMSMAVVKVWMDVSTCDEMIVVETVAVMVVKIGKTSVPQVLGASGLKDGLLGQNPVPAPATWKAIPIG